MLGKNAFKMSLLPCLNPFWTMSVWAEGFQPIYSSGWHRSRRRPLSAVAPPTELGRLEQQKQTGGWDKGAFQPCDSSPLAEDSGSGGRWAACDSQWTSTRMLTLVFPTALKTRQETGSVKKEWSALVVNTLSLAPCSTTPPLAHLGIKY